MGEAFGEICRVEIREFYHLRVVNALAQAKQFGGRSVDEGTLLEIARRSLSVTESYDPQGYAELHGIARGANLSLEQAFAMNGLTDLRDVLAYWDGIPGLAGGVTLADTGVDGCSSFLVMGDKTSDGRMLCGQTWDLATDNMPYVIAVHRQPKDAPETWSLTTAGCLSLIGLNAEGIAIGTNNLRSKDARPGLCYLSLIHKALGQRTLEAAVSCVTTPHRAAAHYYWLASAREKVAAGVECTATLHERTDVTHGFYVHCNHFLGEKTKKLDASPPKTTDSTACRQSRLDELLARAQGVDEPTMQRFLADHENGEAAICRHDFAGISSNGAAVFSPERPRAVACQGTPCTAAWIDLVASS